MRAPTLAQILGGSWLVISGVISPPIWVVTMVTLLITPRITTHEPPSRILAQELSLSSIQEAMAFTFHPHCGKIQLLQRWLWQGLLVACRTCREVGERDRPNLNLNP